MPETEVPITGIFDATATVNLPDGPTEPPDPPSDYEVLDQGGFSDTGQVLLRNRQKFIISNWDLRGGLRFENCTDFFVVDTNIHDSGTMPNAPWAGAFLINSQGQFDRTVIEKCRGHGFFLKNGSSVIGHDCIIKNAGEDGLQHDRDGSDNYSEFYGTKFIIDGPEGDPGPENLWDLKSGEARASNCEFHNWGTPGAKHGENIIAHKTASHVQIEDSLLSYRWSEGGNGGKAIWNALNDATWIIGECTFDLVRDNKWGLSGGVHPAWDRDDVLNGIDTAEGNAPWVRVYEAAEA